MLFLIFVLKCVCLLTLLISLLYRYNYLLCREEIVNIIIFYLENKSEMVHILLNL